MSKPYDDKSKALEEAITGDNLEGVRIEKLGLLMTAVEEYAKTLPNGSIDQIEEYVYLAELFAGLQKICNANVTLYASKSLNSMLASPTLG